MHIKMERKGLCVFLEKHIKKCPKLKKKKPRDPRQMILDHSNSTGSCSSKFDQDVFHELLSTIIVKHGLPFQ